MSHNVSSSFFRTQKSSLVSRNMRWVVSLALGVLSLGFIACGPQPSEIPDGEYGADLTSSPAVTSDLSAKWKDAKISVNRASKKLTLTFAGTSQPLELTFATTDRSVWPVSCPGNYSSRQIEFFTIQTNGGDLEINGISYKEPILYGQCFFEGASGMNPDHVYLAEKSAAIDKEKMGFTCSAASKCVDFRTKASN